MTERRTVQEHFARMGEDGSYLAFYQDDGCARSHDFVARRARVQELLGPNLRRDQAVLDVGCGTGPMIEFFASHGLDYHGVDVAQGMLDSIRQRFGSTPHWRNIELRKSSSEDLPYSNGTFDVVVAMGLVEYLEDIGPTLKELSRVARPGGIALVTTPNRYCANRFMKRNLEWMTRVYRLFRDNGKKGPDRGAELVHRELAPRRLDELMGEVGFQRVGRAFYDHKMVVYPLTRLFPRLSYAVNSRLENRVPRWLANGYIGCYTKA